MPKISYELSDREELILKVLYEMNEKLDKVALRSFMSFSTPIISGSYKDAFDFLSDAMGQIMRRSEEQRLLNKELKGLEYLRLVEIEGKISVDFDSERNEVKVSLTKEGARIAKALCKNRKLIFRPRASSLKTVFIACAFGKSEIDELSNNCLFPACERQKYKPVRIDMIEPYQTITETMMSEITGAVCVIADLTYARPSVYFEVGYAVGLGIPLIPTCKKDHFRGKDDDQRVHFDLEQYKISLAHV